MYLITEKTCILCKNDVLLCKKNAYSFYFDPLKSVERVVNIGCAALFVAVAVLGVIGI